MGELMSFGMFWLLTTGDKRKPLLKKIADARNYYADHFGTIPDLVLVNPKLIPLDWKSILPRGISLTDIDSYLVEDYEIRICTTIESNCLWIGFRPITN